MFCKFSILISLTVSCCRVTLFTTVLAAIGAAAVVIVVADVVLVRLVAGTVALTGELVADSILQASKLFSSSARC